MIGTCLSAKAVISSRNPIQDIIKWSDICVKILPLVILLSVKLVNILSVTVDDWLETLVGWYHSVESYWREKN